MDTGVDETSMFPTWFRSLSLAYISKVLMRFIHSLNSNGNLLIDPDISFGIIRFEGEKRYFILDNPESITLKAVRSVKWSMLIELVSRTIQPVFFLILARLLTPDDFGLASAATIVISFSQLFWDAGLSKALIQTNEEMVSAANVVFWVNAALGVVIYVILFAGAPLIAFIF